MMHDEPDADIEALALPAIFEIAGPHVSQLLRENSWRLASTQLSLKGQKCCVRGSCHMVDTKQIQTK